jgi:beta-lactamase class A
MQNWIKNIQLLVAANFKNKTMLLVLFFLIISISLNIFLFFKLKNNKELAIPQPKSYKFINPLAQVPIDSDTQNKDLFIQFNDLKPAIEKEISRFGTEQNIGFFLQDSTTGTWLGINERTGFAPASLLKIPIMLGVLKEVDREEISLTDLVEITAEDLDKNSGQLYKKGSGYKLSVWKMLEEMVINSDNTAKNVLRRQIDETDLNSVFIHVGIPNPYQENIDPTVTPRGFIRLFKALYFSSFLSPELSEKALDLTTDTHVESLISAGVPPEIQVAHKYGERPDGIADCGIIYQPNNPYYLCIMTKDLTVLKSKELIANLSKIVYEFISAKK